MKHKAAEYKRWLDDTIKSIRQFEAGISFLTGNVDRAIREIPKLKEQIAYFEKMLPVWGEDLRIQKLSLASHLKQLELLKTKYGLVSKIDKARATLSELDRELKKEVS